jgi:predicted HD phosphohydrolase
VSEHKELRLEHVSLICRALESYHDNCDHESTEPHEIYEHAFSEELAEQFNALHVEMLRNDIWKLILVDDRSTTNEEENGG